MSWSAGAALGAAEMQAARGELLRAQRIAQMDLQHCGVISDEALETLSAEIDAQLAGDAGSAPA